MNQRYWSNLFCIILIANLIIKHVIKIKNGIMINVNMSVKTIECAKNIVAGVPAHVFVKIIGI